MRTGSVVLPVMPPQAVDQGRCDHPSLRDRSPRSTMWMDFLTSGVTKTFDVLALADERTGPLVGTQECAVPEQSGPRKDYDEPAVDPNNMENDEVVALRLLMILGNQPELAAIAPSFDSASV